MGGARDGRYRQSSGRPPRAAAPERPASELQIAYRTWEQARAAREDLETSGLLAIRLRAQDEQLCVNLKLPNGETLRLRGEIAGTMLGDGGALDGLLVQLALDAATLARLRDAEQRGPMAPDDVVRLGLLQMELEAQGGEDPELPSSAERDHSGLDSGVRKPRRRSVGPDRDSRRPTLPAEQRKKAKRA